MITEDEAIAMLRRYGADDGLINHCRGVAEFAFRMAEKIALRHPELNVDPEKVKVLSILHDIGKLREGPHEYNTIDILKEEGLHELASIAKHGGMYEKSVIDGKEDKDLIPTQIENRIMNYADNRFNQQPCTFDERMEELKERRKDNARLMKVLDMAYDRFKKEEKELMELAGESL